MILSNRGFRYLENWLLYNLKQLLHHIKCLHQETEISVRGQCVWVGFPVAQVSLRTDCQVSQAETRGFAEVPRGSYAMSINLLAKTSAQVSWVQWLKPQ